MLGAVQYRRVAVRRALSGLRLGAYSKSDVQGLVSSIAAKQGVPPSLALSLAQHESGFDPLAKNPGSSAAGVMQLTAATQQTYGVSNPFDPVQNITAGVTFLRQMLTKYNGDQSLALLAYAWGPGNVDSWLSTGTGRNGAPLNPESRQAVQDILGVDVAAAYGGGAADSAGGGGFDLSDYLPADLTGSDTGGLAIAAAVVAAVALVGAFISR